MNCGLSEEQELLRQEVRKYLDEECPLDIVRKIMREDVAYSQAQWKNFAELGWTGLMIPEAQGGAGLGWVDCIVVLEEMGRSLQPAPFLSTILGAALIGDIGTEDDQNRLLPEIANGSRIPALAVFDHADALGAQGIRLEAESVKGGYRLSGQKCGVADVGRANLVLLAFRDESGGIRLAAIDADTDTIQVEITQSLDETKRVGNLTFDSLHIPDAALLGESPVSEDEIERLLDRGAIATSAEILGTGESALAMTVQYAKDRVQFRSPIGRFQGVKHPLAEIYVDLESLRSLLYFAAWALDESPDEVPLAASLTKAFASEAITRIGVDAIQLHGAVGYTEEYDVQLFLKRTKWVRPSYGDENHHLDRVARLRNL